MNTKTILVTGAGGFLGENISRALIEKGYNVIGLARNIYPELEKIGVKFIKCDLSNSEQTAALDLKDVDGVIHTAALAGVWGDKDTFYKINYQGTINLVNTMIEQKVKNLVYTSSPSVVFGKDDIENANEEMEYPTKYYTHYARTKAMAEKFVLDLGKKGEINSISLRPHLIWGPGDPHLIPRVIQRARAGKLKVVGTGDNLVDIIHVKNAAKAHILALEKCLDSQNLSGNAYFIAQEKPVKLWDFINTILTQKKIPSVTKSIGFSTAYKIGAVFEFIFRFFGIIKPEPPMTRFIAMQLAKSHYFNHDKAKNDLGYEVDISIEEGLKTI